jgi:hypothetical protein
MNIIDMQESNITVEMSDTFHTPLIRSISDDWPHTIEQWNEVKVEIWYDIWIHVEKWV